MTRQSCHSERSEESGRFGARNQILRCLQSDIFLVVLLLVTAPAIADELPAKVNYQDHILPLLRNSCLNCHNADKARAGLDLSSYSKAMAGSGSRKVIAEGDPSSSVLYRAIAHKEEPFMPLRGDKLPDAQLALVKRWIEQGALENSGSVAAVPKPSASLALSAAAVGKPEGPPPMPNDLLLEPVVTPPRPGAVAALAASPWAPLLAVGAHQQVLLYHTDTLELLGVLPFAEGMPHVLKFSRNGSLLLAGGGIGAKSGRVVVWDVVTGQRVIEVGDEYDIVLAADISPDQSLVALGGPSRTIKIFSTRDGQLLHVIKKHTDWARALAFSPDGVLLASGDRAGGLFVWEARTAREFYALSGHKNAVTDVCFRGDSNVLLSASEDDSVRLWDMNNGNQIKSWGGHGGGTLSAQFTHDGRIVTAGRDKTIKLWNTDGGGIRTLEAFDDIALRAVFSHDGARVIGGDWTGQIRAYDAADGALAGKLAPNPPMLATRLTRAESLLAELLPVHQKVSSELGPAEQVAAEANAKLQASNEALAAAQSQMDAAQGQVNGLSAATQVVEAQLKPAQEALAKKQAENDRLAKAATDATAARDRAMSDHEQLEKRVAARQRVAKALEQAAQVAQAEAAKNAGDGALAGSAAAATAAAKHAAGEASTAREKLPEAIQQVRAMSDRAALAEAAAGEAAAAVQQLKQKIDAHSQELAEAKAQLKQAEEAAAVARTALANAKQTADGNTAEVESANKKLAELRVAADATEAKLKTAQAEVARVRAAQVNVSLNAARAELQYLEAQQPSAADAAVAEARAKVEAMNAEYQRLLEESRP